VDDPEFVAFLALVAAVPAVIAEGLARLLRRWPRIGYGLGGIVATALILVAGASLSLCAVGDELDEHCDEKGSLGLSVALIGGAAAVILTVLVLVFPRRQPLRVALWVTPALCFAALLVGVEAIT
jgi:hypothetical protein